MKLFSNLIIGCALFVLAGAAIRPAKKAGRLFVSNFENVLGTSLEIRIQSVAEVEANAAEQAAMNEIDRLSSILSAYDSTSEFSKFLKSSGVPVKLSPELFEVLDLFDGWRSRTNGALDASAEVIGRVWKNAATKQQLPSDEELSEAIGIVKQQHYTLNKANLTAIHLDNAPLVLNSFAKSYIINKAAEAAFKNAGVTAVVVNIGGDIVVRGDLKESVRITDPMASAENDAPLTELMVKNRAIATSGNYRRGFEIKNKWYSHIVDPRTGQPADHIISATVVAPNASDAGALATAFNVLSTAESLKLLASLPNAEALLITRGGKRIESKGWKSLEVPVAKSAVTKLPATAAAFAKTWNTKYELAINIEVAKIEGARVHAPFVAVWIEDENKNPVRNIAVWYSKPKWLRDLRSWNRGNGAAYADAAKMSSIGSATRSAGKYTVKWDGKDDNGQLVNAGKYTVFIEAAREHGTYQIMSSEMNFDGSAKLINLNGNVEIAAASLEYRKKPRNEN